MTTLYEQAINRQAFPSGVPDGRSLGIDSPRAEPTQSPPALPETFFLAARKGYGGRVSVRGFGRLGDLKNSRFLPFRNEPRIVSRYSYWAVINGKFVPLSWEEINNARGQVGLLRLLVEKAYS